MKNGKPELLPVGGSFEIEYVNTEGIQSRRVIDVRKFVANLSDGYVQAFFLAFFAIALPAIRICSFNISQSRKVTRPCLIARFCHFFSFILLLLDCD